MDSFMPLCCWKDRKQGWSAAHDHRGQEPHSRCGGVTAGTCSRQEGTLHSDKNALPSCPPQTSNASCFSRAMRRSYKPGPCLDSHTRATHACPLRSILTAAAKPWAAPKATAKCTRATGAAREPGEPTRPGRPGGQDRVTAPERTQLRCTLGWVSTEQPQSKDCGTDCCPSRTESRAAPSPVWS